MPGTFVITYYILNTAFLETTDSQGTADPQPDHFDFDGDMFGWDVVYELKAIFVKVEWVVLEKFLEPIVGFENKIHAFLGV